ncbi:MAG: response regulator transcription factor [Planctomycetes bacterium]|nr:response regulator transcription factor [Planctomycetota bacterium]
MIDSNVATIFLVDDQEETRTRHERVLREAGFNVATFANAAQFLEVYNPGAAGCIVCEFKLPDMGALELLRVLQAKELEPTFMVLTRHDDVSNAVRSLKAGAFDFLEKPVETEVLTNQVQLALQEDAKRRRARRVRTEISDRHVRLTRREREVMKLMVSGKASKEIASYLELSPRTVESHRARIMRKMEANSLPELVRYSMLMQSTCCSQILKALHEVEPNTVTSLQPVLV